MRNDGAQKYAAARHYFGGTAAAYDERRAHKPKWSEETRLVETYLSRLARGASVLDVPFGTGRFALLYVAAGLAVAGVDISADMIAQARQRHGGAIAGFDLRTAPAEQLPFADRSFDYLICNRFIKWLPSEAMVAAVAREFRRVCCKEMLIQVKLTGSPAASLTASLSRLISRPFRSDDFQTAHGALHDAATGTLLRGRRLDHLRRHRCLESRARRQVPCPAAGLAPFPTGAGLGPDPATAISS